MKLLQKISRLRDRCWPWCVFRLLEREAETAKRQMQETVIVNSEVVSQHRGLERALTVLNRNLQDRGLQHLGVPHPALWASHNYDPLRPLNSTPQQLYAEQSERNSLPVEQPKQETLKP